jgi:hypothetical protein
LEEVDAGLIHSEHGAYTEYTDSRRDEWQVKILPAPKQMGAVVVHAISGMSRSAVFEVLAGRSRPHRGNRERLSEIVRKRRLV